MIMCTAMNILPHKTQGSDNTGNGISTNMTVSVRNQMKQKYTLAIVTLILILNAQNSHSYTVLPIMAEENMKNIWFLFS